MSGDLVVPQEKPSAPQGSSRAEMLQTFAKHKSSAEWSVEFLGLLQSVARTGDRVLAAAVLAMGGHGNSLVPVCEEGRERLVGELLELGASPGARDQHGEAPIHAAALGGFRDIVDMLVAKHEAGKDDRRDADGKTALYLASEAGHLSTVELLLGVGADPSIIPIDWKYSAFDVAAGNGRLDVMEAFGRFGAVASIGSSPAGTADSALRLACIRNQARAIELLVQQFGAEPRSLDSEGSSGLHNAAVVGQADAIKIMLKHGADPLALDSFERSALQIAAEYGHVAAVEAICDERRVDVNRRTNKSISCGPCHDTWSALDFAANGGHVDVMKALVARGADMNAESELRTSALYTAAAANKPDAIDFLVQAGVNVDGPSGLTRRPLDFAVETGSTEAIRTLVRHGANLYVQNDEELYPLQYAVTTKHEAAVNALLDLGAEPNMGRRDSPLHRAVMEWSSCSENIAKTLLERGANIHHLNEDGETPLHAAVDARSGGAAAVEFLVKAGADVNHNHLRGEGRTPLQAACQNRNRESVVALLEHGADLALGGWEGNTALHIAAGVGSVDIVDTLLRAAGDGTAPEAAVNLNGDTPASFAAQEVPRMVSQEHWDRVGPSILRLLERAPADRTWRRRRPLLLCRASSGTARRLASKKEEPPAKKVSRTALATNLFQFDEESGDSLATLLERCFDVDENGIFRTIVGFL